MSFLKVINAVMVADSVIDPESDDDFYSETISNSKGSTGTEETDTRNTEKRSGSELQKSEYDDFDDFDISPN